MNTFMNFVNRFSAGGGTRGGIRASGKIGALVETLLFPVLDLLAGPWALVSSSCFPVRLGEGLTGGLRQAQNPGAIATELKNKECNAILPNGLANLLGIELLEL